MPHGRRALPLVAVVAALLVPATAQAIPSDPPVTPLTPADGVTLPTSQDGIAVTYACPSYNQAEPVTYEGVTFTFPGSAADYFVDFSTSAEVGTDGRFIQSARVDLAVPFSNNELPVGTCLGTMQSNDAVPGVEITPGLYYWQVLRTLGTCLGCAPLYEAGPVRSFTLRNEVTLTVNPVTTVYSGYDHRFEIRTTGVADGLGVVLEHRRGNAWTAIGRATSRAGKAAAFAHLPRGPQTIRVAFELGGQRSYGKARVVTVRDGKTAPRQTSASTDGSWTGRADGAPEAASFRVVNGGRLIRDLKLPVLLGCPNPGPTGGTILIRTPGVIRIAGILVAPDGRFAKYRTDKAGIAEVSGRLVGGRLREGKVGLVRGECTITGGWNGQRSG